MKSVISVFLLGFIVTTVGYAQYASATWQSPADTTTTAAVVTGNITAPSQKLSTTSDTLTNLTVKDYVSGTTADPTVGVQRLWLNNHFWPLETAQQNSRFIQYSVSSLPNNKFTVTSISINIGELGSTNKFFANVYYSTDSTFTTRTQLNSTVVTLSNAASTPSLTTLSYSPADVIDTGKTFYVRIYPWYNATSTTPGKYVLLANVVISGTTVLAGAPSMIVTPSSLSFGAANVNTSRDRSFSISGTLLSPTNGSLTISAPTGFSISKTNGSGYSSTINVSYSGSTLNSTTIYVRFTPTTIASYTDSISVSGGGAVSQKVIVTGTSVASNVVLGVFVSTTGSDTNAGTFNFPFATIPKALSVVQVGDTVFVRRGRYSLASTITLSTSGIDSSNRRNLFAYGSERPVLDFSSMAFSSSNRGIILSGSYWHIKGFDIYKAGDNGMNISGSYNIVEFCALYENQDSGLQLSSGASNNYIINCDSYFNYDAPNGGGNADGFSPKLDVGTNNHFYGCRAWQNSDDGWDCFGATASVTLDNCWTWSNGYLKDGSDPGSQANGNGFKMGGNYTENDATLRNCLSFGNKSKGFDQNHDRGSMTLYNCTGYNNVGNNYSISEALDSGKMLTISNCIELGNKISIGSFAIQSTNSWLNPPFTGTTSADFISIDTTGVRGQRKPDGSLPDINFMHLASKSQFVNAGTNVGLPFIGTAPDLGCFESSVLTGVTNKSNVSIPNTFALYQNYPNPFNPSTEIRYSVPTVSVVKLSIYDILGQEVATLMNEQMQPGNYSIRWDASRMSSGLYFTRLSAQTVTGQPFLQTHKMLLTK